MNEDLSANSPAQCDGYNPEAESLARQDHFLVDAFEQAQLQEGVDIEIHQLSAGAYQGVCSTLRAGHMHFVREQQNQLVYKTGILPKNVCTISFFLSQDPAMRFSHLKGPGAHTFLLPEDTEVDILVPGHVDTLYLRLEQHRLMAAARIINERFWDQAPRELHAYNTPDTGRLAADFLALLSLNTGGQNLPLSARMESMLIDSILLTLNQSTEVLGNNALNYMARQQAGQRVRQAREFINASLQAGHLPSIVEICACTGVSERALQYAFRDQLQLTPVAYLRIHRLNRVRRDLLNPATGNLSVTQIAMSWGFLHLGKFAQDYRKLFGERPSETLARGKFGK